MPVTPWPAATLASSGTGLRVRPWEACSMFGSGASPLIAAPARHRHTRTLHYHVWTGQRLQHEVVLIFCARRQLRMHGLAGGRAVGTAVNTASLGASASGSSGLAANTAAVPGRLGRARPLGADILRRARTKLPQRLTTKNLEPKWLRIILLLSAIMTSKVFSSTPVSAGAVWPVLHKIGSCSNISNNVVRYSHCFNDKGGGAH